MKRSESKTATLPVLLTVQEVAGALRCSPTWVKTKIVDGKLIASKIAGSYLVTPADLESFIEASKCPKPIEAPTLPAKRGKTAGISAGIKPGSPDIAAQALATLRKRQADSRNSSQSKTLNSSESQTGQVVPISGR